jgi:hypothetical protein
MSDKSPLFVSSMELVAHAVELYTAGKPRKYKFVILHLANSIELILKDLVIDKGQSIYKPKQPQTIGIWEAFEKLQENGVVIPERPIIELLIDDRNTIQHRFSYPDAESVYYYLENVITFLNRLLNDEYGIDLKDVLKSHLALDELAVIGLAEKEDDNEHGLDRLYQISPESAVIQACKLIEHRFNELTARKGIHIHTTRMLSLRDFPRLLGKLGIEGYLSSDAKNEFQMLQQLRNRAAHAAHFREDESIPEWSEGLRVAKELLNGLDRAINEGFSDDSGSQTDSAGPNPGANDT